MWSKRCIFSISLMTAVLVSLSQSQNEADSIGSKTVELDEVVVKAALVKHDSRSDEYVLHLSYAREQHLSTKFFPGFPA